MSSKRLISAVFGIPLVILILVFGNIYVVDVVFAIIAAFSLHEYFNSFKEKANPVIWIGYLSTVIIAFMHVLPQGNTVNTMANFIFLIIFLLFVQVIITKMKTTIHDISVTFFGICYISLFLMFVPIIRNMENGQFMVWYVFAAAWGTDILAYLVGKNFGKHKFSQISPNKSIEGCIAGIIGAILLMWLATYIFNTYCNLDISYLTITFLAVILSIVGQIGDFAASSIKRYVGIKDFSNLIPGHGGMLDRFDSVILIAPMAYFLLSTFL